MVIQKPDIEYYHRPFSLLKLNTRKKDSFSDHSLFYSKSPEMAQSVAYYKMGSLRIPLFVVLEVEETLAHIKQVLCLWTSSLAFSQEVPLSSHKNSNLMALSTAGSLPKVPPLDTGFHSLQLPPPSGSEISTLEPLGDRWKPRQVWSAGGTVHTCNEKADFPSWPSELR